MKNNKYLKAFIISAVISVSLLFLSTTFTYNSYKSNNIHDGWLCDGFCGTYYLTKGWPLPIYREAIGLGPKSIELLWTNIIIELFAIIIFSFPSSVAILNRKRINS